MSKRNPYDLIGTTVAGKYYLESFAGEGGMGEVYRARLVGTEELVAVKVIRPGKLQNTQSEARAIKLFKQEAKSLQNLSHPNIVKVYESGDYNGTLFIAMEWLEGADLYEEISTGGPFTLERTARILHQVCDALYTAHSHRIIHLDVKPRNIYIMNKGASNEQAKLIDFGFSRIMNSSIGTTLSVVLGTPHYIAPEIFENKKVSPRSDIYSLGATTYEMLTGLPVYNHSDVRELMRGNPRRPPSARKINQTVPELVDELIASALNFSPSLRPKSAREFYEVFIRGVKSNIEPLIIKPKRNQVYRPWTERFFEFAKLNTTANLVLSIDWIMWHICSFSLLLLSADRQGAMALPYAWLWWIGCSLMPIPPLINRKITLLEAILFYVKNALPLLMALMSLAAYYS